MSIEIKIGKRDATARVLGVELVRIRRDRWDSWNRVFNGKMSSSELPLGRSSTDGTVRAWLEKEACRIAASELEGARNALRWTEDRLASAQRLLASAEAEVPEARDRLARAERVAAALVADVLEGTL